MVRCARIDPGAVVVGVVVVGVVGDSSIPYMSRQVRVASRITAIAVKVSLLLSLIALLPPHKAADSAHSAAMPIMKIKAPIGKKALKAISLSGNMRPASL